MASLPCLHIVFHRKTHVHILKQYVLRQMTDLFQQGILRVTGPLVKLADQLQVLVAQQPRGHVPVLRNKRIMHRRVPAAVSTCKADRSARAQMQFSIREAAIRLTWTMGCPCEAPPVCWAPSARS